MKMKYLTKATVLVPCLLILCSSFSYSQPKPHSHAGRTHLHPLPKQGIKHRHGNGSIGVVGLRTKGTATISATPLSVPEKGPLETRLQRITQHLETYSQNRYTGPGDYDYLSKLSQEGNVQAQVLLAYKLDQSRVSYRLGQLQGQSYVGEVEMDRLQKGYTQVRDELFSLYKKLHVSVGRKYAYNLAEMMVFDGLSLDDGMTVKILLESSYGKTEGQAEALTGLILESGNPDVHTQQKAMEFFRDSASQGNPFSLARVTRELLPGDKQNTINDTGALSLLIKADRASKNYRQTFSDNSGKDLMDKPWKTDGRIWSFMSKRELTTLLGPVAFREATRLAQSNNEGTDKQALELYKLASRYDIQKAHMAIAYFYKHGQMSLPVSKDYAGAYFQMANRAADNPSLGAYNVTDQLFKTSNKEYRKLNGMNTDDSLSSGEILAIIGIGLLILGQMSSGSDITPDNDSWTPGKTTYDSCQGLNGLGWLSNSAGNASALFGCQKY